MSKSLPARCDVAIIGGGIVGASIAYHLGKLGITDTVLLERKQLTSGTTWHAAGLVGQLRASKNLTELAKYTTNLFEGLEKGGAAILPASSVPQHDQSTCRLRR